MGSSERSNVLNQFNSPPPPRTVLARVCSGVRSSGAIEQLRTRTRVPELLLAGARDDASGAGSSTGDGLAGGACGEARGLHGQHSGGHRWWLSEGGEDGALGGKASGGRVSRGGERKREERLGSAKKEKRKKKEKKQNSASTLSRSLCSLSLSLFLVEERQRVSSEREPSQPLSLPPLTMLAASRRRLVATAAAAAASPPSRRSSSARRRPLKHSSQQRLVSRSPPNARPPPLLRQTTTTSTASASASAASAAASAALASTTFSAATLAAVCAYAALVTRPRSKLVICLFVPFLSLPLVFHRFGLFSPRQLCRLLPFPPFLHYSFTSNNNNNNNNRPSSSPLLPFCR